MIREISSSRLLAQADRLASGDGGRGQPRNADLRRAVSAAYYALFHRVTIYTAERLVPDAPREHQLRLVRSLDHGAVAQICRLVVGRQGAPGTSHYGPVVDDLRSETRLAAMCTTFLEAQQRRHQADYDHLADFSRPGTVTFLTTTRQAVVDLGHVSRTTHGRMFFLLIAMQSGLRR